MKTMNKKLAMFFLLFICTLSSAQEADQLNDMINECLLYSLDYYSDMSSKATKDRRGAPTYICWDNLPWNFSFSDDILEKDVRIMSLNNISGQRQLRKKKEYKFLFTSIRLDNNLLRITISVRFVSKIRKKLHIAISDWIVFTYAYSCDESEWQLIEKKAGGI